MKPHQPWYPLKKPLRPEFLAWRCTDNYPAIEVLAYNYALWQTADPMSQFAIESAPSLAAVSSAPRQENAQPRTGSQR